MEKAPTTDTVAARDSGYALRPRRGPLVVIAAVATIALGLWLLAGLAQVALLAFGGVLLALFFRSISDFVARHTPLSPGLSLAAVLAVLATLVAAAVAGIAPKIASQLDQLIQTLPIAVDRMVADLRGYTWGRWLIDEASRLGDSLHAPRMLSQATSFLSSTLGILTGALVVLFIGLFVAAEPKLYRHGALRLFPPSARSRAAEILGETAHALRFWILGRVVSMTIIGVLTWIGLAVLGVKLALSLALLAAVLTFIPYIGPTLSVIPAALLGLLHSPQTALYVVALYLGVQLLESYLITPLVQRSAVKLPPALTLVAQIAMGLLVGALGVMFAAPLVVALIVLVKRAYVGDVLGDPEMKAPT